MWVFKVAERLYLVLGLRILFFRRVCIGCVFPIGSTAGSGAAIGAGGGGAIGGGDGC